MSQGTHTRQLSTLTVSKKKNPLESIIDYHLDGSCDQSKEGLDLQAWPPPKRNDEGGRAKHRRLRD